MKLCKDCRWMQGSTAHALCGHPSAVITETNPVTGKTTEKRWSCELFRTIRLHPHFCGLHARYWEPRDDPPAGFV